MARTDPSHPSWHELAVEARTRFLVELGRAPSVEVERGAGVTVVCSGVLRMAMTEGQDRGCRWAVLEPTPESAAFYDVLGLEVEPCRPGVELYLPLEPARGDGR